MFVLFLCGSDISLCCTVQEFFYYGKIEMICMKELFCNECSLSYDIPRLVAETLLGVESLYKTALRYKQMRDCYDCTCAEWQQVFTDELKPFREYDDTTSVTIPIGNSPLGADIKALHMGAIGVDLPVWFNMQEDNKCIMIIAQDPLRNNDCYGECFDAVVSTPFGLHGLEHRQNARGGKMADMLVKMLVGEGYGVYLTDANKFFIYDHKITDKFSAAHLKAYAEVLKREIECVRPSAIVCLGRRAEKMCRKFGIQGVLPLPHLSGTARGAMVRRFRRLRECGTTAENIAEVYATEIVGNIK